ncbi:hypothetical protein TrLO_g12197 [Triparma laevis f. longispina]|uniref:Uncharacterized protein n=1 Tax=Triparma laevis f. longispina TaxID=1714387 RepID=A0A9W6ZIH2_9STRA|nr:hypothetical protein TrLO_g12197 [Triparma laevis f. longispina]
MFSSILTVKKELHKFYDVVRARYSEAVLDPLFALADTLSKQVEGKKKYLKRTLASIKMAGQLNSELTVSGSDQKMAAANKALKEENENLKRKLKDAAIQMSACMESLTL